MVTDALFIFTRHVRKRGARLSAGGSPIHQTYADNAEHHANKRSHRQSRIEKCSCHQSRHRRSEVEQTHYSRRRGPAYEEVEQPDRAKRQNDDQLENRE